MIPIPQPKKDQRTPIRHGQPCVICEREIKPNAKQAFVHVWLGAYLITEAEAADMMRECGTDYGAGDCGFHPVGPECAKRKDLVGYVTRPATVTKRRLSIADAKAILAKTE